ncbi:uncharacterized protein DNG_00078 [Cephalotrichum gorgonifer]|uniref:Uncharacterized protein n=1 Tax=Cephalotrichum gorgonifer TaxID=2041049 RepID=A0AAE8SQF3_9PEZI|nr:uncharacterized protein DNG_00078 [Cephalotrichum gorgonifer]
MHIVDTLHRNFVFGVLDCWDTESGTDRGRRVISRMWTPLWRDDPYETTYYTRLTWPSVFIPVRLLQKESLAESTESSDQDTDFPLAVGAEEAISDTDRAKSVRGSVGEGVVDFFTPRFRRRDVLIKRPFARSIAPPKWVPGEGGSPFLICFPRGDGASNGRKHRYRLYRIFPSSLGTTGVIESEEEALPVVFPARGLDGLDSAVRSSDCVSDEEDKDQNGKNKRGNGGADEDTAKPIFCSLIVFVREKYSTRKRSPRQYLAICLANVPVHQAGQPAQYEPRCKVLTHWTRANQIDLRTLDVRTFSTVDQTTGALVTVQKVACLGESRVSDRGKRLRSVELTQVVFDKITLQEDMAMQEESRGNNEREWVWDVGASVRARS